MSEDQASKEAAELLPGPFALLDAPTYDAQRTAVAAALQEREDKIREMFGDNMALQDRIAALEAELTKERDWREKYGHECSVLRECIAEAIGKYDDGSWRHDDIFKLARAALAQRPKP